MTRIIELEIERLKKQPPAPQRTAEDAPVLRQIVEYYHQNLLQSPKALEYLHKRKLDDPEAIDHFKLGFASGALSPRLAAQTNTEEAAALNKQLQRIGLLSPDGQEHFNDTIIVPIFAPDGEVLQLYGRRISEYPKTSRLLHRHLPGPCHGVWNETALAQNKEAIFCKGLLDALTFWCAGYRNVTTSYGTEGFTDEHIDAFKRYGIERIIIAYDCTQAGERAVKKLKWALRKEGIDCYRMPLPDGSDPNQYARLVSLAEPPESLGVAIQASEWLGAGERKRPLTAPRPPYGIWPPLADKITAQDFAAQQRSHIREHDGAHSR